MPAWVHDEARWSKAKEASGKQTEKDSDSYYKLANYIYHKMGKSEESELLAKIFKKELVKQGLVKVSSTQKLHEFLTNRKRK